MDPELLALGPSRRLQTHPNTASFLYRRSEAWLAAEAKTPLEPGTPLPPPGDGLVGVMLTTGPRTSGTFHCGTWSFDMEPDEEQVALAVSPKDLLDVPGLELRVYPLAADVKPEHGPGSDLTVEWRGRGSRLTSWRRLAGSPSSTMLADGDRALGLRLDDDGRLVMDWAHRVKKSMFYEVDGLARDWRKGHGSFPVLRVLLRRGAGEGGPWYQAKETPFTKVG